MHADTITIRRLGPEDAGVLNNVAPGVFDDPVDPGHTAAFLGADTHEMVVAMAGARVVGMASGVIYYHPDKAPQFWINEVGTGDDWQGQGIATRLVAAILQVSRDRGCGYAWLGTEADNTAARALYRRAGGTETEGLVLFDWDDEGEEI